MIRLFADTASNLPVALNKKYNGGKARINSYLGVEKRKDALRSADFVINANQSKETVVKEILNILSVNL